MMDWLIKVCQRRGLDSDEVIRKSHLWKPPVTRDIDAEFETLRYL